MHTTYGRACECHIRTRHAQHLVNIEQNLSHRSAWLHVRRMKSLIRYINRRCAVPTEATAPIIR